MTDHDYGFFVTADGIYRWLTEGPGADTLNTAQDATRTEMERETQRAHQIFSLADSIQAGWQGGASGAAYGAATPLAETALAGSMFLTRSQDLLSRQSASFSDAANRVQPVPEAPPENALDDAFPFDNDIDKETRDYQAAAQNNFAVFGEYDGASSYNETNMPKEYNTTDRNTGTVTVTPPPDTIEVGDPREGAPRGGGPGDSQGPGNYSAYGSGPSGYPGSSGPAAGGPYPGGAPGSPGSPGYQQTTPNDYRPSPQSPYPYPPVPRPSPVSADQGGYPGGAPYGGYQGAGGPGGGTGGFGPRGGGAGGGPGGTGGPGAGARGFGPAPGPGAAAGALAAEEAAARRAAQAAAGARPGGAGPMGAPMGGGKGKDDEDTEHERKILLETDAEETFGSDVLTAPQVIGDDEYED